jgi:hypothetical protein
MKIAINIIATNKYIQFVQPLVDSIEKYFLVDHDITVNLFTDQDAVIIHNRTDIKIHKIPSYGFPDASLYRFKIQTDITYDCDYLYYLDADILINDFVGEEIFAPILVVRHPGYFVSNGWGSNNTPQRSTAFLPLNKRLKYFAGGVNGGETKTYLDMMFKLRDNINIDTANGVMADYHDETHLNHFMAYCEDYKELNPSYCLPQAWAKRVYSKISYLPAKILALEKDFNYFRN